MSYIMARREQEKERRRAEILDAAEALYAKKGWDALTVDQVARSARLSRAPDCATQAQCGRRIGSKY